MTHKNVPITRPSCWRARVVCSMYVSFSISTLPPYMIQKFRIQSDLDWIKIRHFRIDGIGSKQPDPKKILDLILYVENRTGSDLKMYSNYFFLSK